MRKACNLKCSDEMKAMTCSESSNNNYEKKKKKKKKKKKGLYCVDNSGCWRDWAGLPRHLLFETMDRLAAVDDYVRFGAVCTSWRAIFLEEGVANKKKHCSQPFLVVASPQEDDRQMVLYCLNKKKICTNFSLGLADTTYCCGSSFGWLITMEIKGWYKYHVQLRNPFISSSRVIDLPPLDNIVKRRPDPKGDISWNSPIYLCKAVLSSDPSSSDEFQVAAIVGTRKDLIVFDSRHTNRDWVPTGKSWKREFSWERFHDIIFFSKTKQFYAARQNNKPEVLAIDLRAGTGRRPKLVQVVPPTAMALTDKERHNHLKSYLVEDLPAGELLLVHKRTNNESTFIYFEVFKLDPVNKEWMQMSDISGKVLFLGNNTSAIRFASDCPGCEPNSVYYTEDIRSVCHKRGYGPRHDGVYNFQNHTLQPHYSILPSKKRSPPSIWIEPTLQR